MPQVFRAACTECLFHFGKCTKIFPPRLAKPEVPYDTSAKQVGTFERRNQKYPLIHTELTEIEEQRCHTLEAISPKTSEGPHRALPAIESGKNQL